jgi:uroporphyrinogen III methyltransferase/synthase
MGLTGKTIVITRAAAQAADLRQALESRGARVLECPMIQIVPPGDWTPVDEAIRRLDTYHWLLFTSTNAVDQFFERMERDGVKCKAPIAVVGAATEARLAKWNLRAEMVPPDFRAEGLLEAFPERLDGIRILFPRAEEGRDVLPDELRRRGAVVDLVTVYRTIKAGAEPMKTILASDTVDCVVFTSPSAINPELASALKGAAIAVIGKVTRDAAEAAGLRPSIEPGRATVQDLAAAIEAYYD